MRSGALGTVAAATVATVLVLGGTAVADKDPVPSREQVDAARSAVAGKAESVAAIQARLAVANAKLDKAAQEAEIAAEGYNGARFRLARAKQESKRARAAADKAAAKVESQRAGIAQLVTQSYLDGSQFNGLKAFLGSDGPAGIMNRVNVVNSAGDSMQARYDAYTALSALARTAQRKADDAEREQRRLTIEAQALQDRAAAAADAAQALAARIDTRRTALIADLAAAQKISVRLAGQRQAGLERIARARAAAAAAAEAEKKAAEAKKKAAAAAQAAQQQGTGGGGGTDAPGPPSGSGTSAGAARAIAFAKAQLGDPYLWAAAGPDAWDCSGLMMMAWRQGGVSLPHYSAAQYERTQHLGLGDLRPGDLVFWGSSPATIHHVAMYLGEAQIIHAPRTGSPVRIDSLYYWVPPDYFGRP